MPHGSQPICQPRGSAFGSASTSVYSWSGSWCWRSYSRTDMKRRLSGCDLTTGAFPAVPLVFRSVRTEPYARGGSALRHRILRPRPATIACRRLLIMVVTSLVLVACDSNPTDPSTGWLREFDAYWQNFETTYSYFSYKRINWDSLRAVYR